MDQQVPARLHRQLDAAALAARVRRGRRDQQAPARQHREPGAVALTAMVHRKRRRAGVAMINLAARTPGGGPRARIDGQHEHAGQHDREPPPPCAARPRALTALPVLLPGPGSPPGAAVRRATITTPPGGANWTPTRHSNRPCPPARRARARSPHLQTRPNRITSRRGPSPFTDQHAEPSDGTGSIDDHRSPPGARTATASRDRSDQIVLFRGLVTNRQLEVETAHIGGCARAPPLVRGHRW